VAAASLRGFSLIEAALSVPSRKIEAAKKLVRMFLSRMEDQHKGVVYLDFVLKGEVRRKIELKERWPD
jgi:hypothetical protein